MKRRNVDNSEARVVLQDQIERLKKLSYEELRRYLKADSYEKINSGKKYQIEIAGMWDDDKKGYLRISVEVESLNGALTEHFVITPDNLLLPPRKIKWWENLSLNVASWFLMVILGLIVLVIFLILGFSLGVLT